MKLTRRDFIGTTINAALLTSAGAAISSPLTAAEPSLEKLDLFEAGTSGYATYRIPGIVVTKRGTMLAYCEARKSERGDWNTIDILLRRSTDGGKTWDAPRKIANVEGPKTKNPAALAQKLANPDDVTYNNAVMIADKSGAVHFLFCLEYMRCFYARSDDDGLTFSKPVEITATFEQFRSEYNWKVLATGPGHGIQLRNGRLLVPVWLSDGTEGHAHRPSWVSVIYSDDSGKTWKRGEIVARHSEELVYPSETTAVELSDGRVMLNIRSESATHRRAVSLSQDGSRDGAKGWTTPAFDQALPEPICLGSLQRISGKARGEKSRILFVNPDNLRSKRLQGSVEGKSRTNADRQNLVLKLSYDEARTWAVKKALDPGVAGYADLAVNPNSGAIFCFYERGGFDDVSTRTKYLTLARFNLEWLTDGKDST
ncbi:MAG: sialidase family protein [Blastocatellia bacterium]